MKEMGMDEQYVINELPLSRGYQYMHCIYRSYDAETYYPKDELEEAEAMELFDSIINQPLDENLY